MHFDCWNDYSNFSHSVRSESRFILGEKAQRFLDAIARTANMRVGTLGRAKALWRAQVGCDWRETEHHGSMMEEQIPYGSSRMKPLRYSALEGRVNPRGIPCLYAAGDMKTAISEVRPWVGAMVSVSQLEINRDLRLVSFLEGADKQLNIDVFFEEPAPEEREGIVWQEIGRAFSRPVSPDPGIAEYAPTQLIAERLKHEGYDGIVYKSHLGPGINFALFDIDAITVRDGRLHAIKGVSYDIGEAENWYSTKQHEKSV